MKADSFYIQTVHTLKKLYLNLFWRYQSKYRSSLSICFSPVLSYILSHPVSQSNYHDYPFFFFFFFLHTAKCILCLSSGSLKLGIHLKSVCCAFRCSDEGALGFIFIYLLCHSDVCGILHFLNVILIAIVFAGL